eukprot:TRINITY_DN1715_c0_g2_i1.p1 TRINITY_DN1715_c0_g2~~TRINITY_DN1715_c0_g2_i1.p1  ORF type:complete len:235 (+),score=39.87 TRINITY_DN1715_c0_g2_i1:98-802(+)
MDYYGDSAGMYTGSEKGYAAGAPREAHFPAQRSGGNLGQAVRFFAGAGEAGGSMGPAGDAYGGFSNQYPGYGVQAVQIPGADGSQGYILGSEGLKAATSDPYGVYGAKPGQAAGFSAGWNAGFEYPKSTSQFDYGFGPKTAFGTEYGQSQFGQWGDQWNQYSTQGAQFGGYHNDFGYKGPKYEGGNQYGLGAGDYGGFQGGSFGKGLGAYGGSYGSSYGGSYGGAYDTYGGAYY